MSYGFKMLKGEQDWKVIDGKSWYLIGNAKTKPDAEHIAERVRKEQPDGMKRARIIKKKLHYSIYTRR
jgi:hypothetical protein